MKCRNCSIGSCAIYTLSSIELNAMEEKTIQTSFGRGEILRHQSTPIDSVIYLRSGYVKEYQKNTTSSDQVIQLVKPKSYIGLQGLCTNNISIFTYQAIAPVEVCFIDKNTFSTLIRGNGNFAREILISLSHESIGNHKRFLSLNQNQTFGKVAGLLLYLSEEIYESPQFELQLKRAELAQMVASTRESVTRALRSLHREEIIRIENNLLEIANKERLEAIARRG